MTNIPALPRDGATEEYVRIVAVNATPRATREIERTSAENEELTEVFRCWKAGDWSTALSPYRLLGDEITVVGRLVMRDMRIVVPASLRKRVLRVSPRRTPRDRENERLPPKQGVVAEYEQYGGKSLQKCPGCQAVTPAATIPPVKDNDHANKAMEGPCSRSDGSTPNRGEP